MEIVTLLKHLEPAKRLLFFRWVCSHAIMPGTYNVHPAVAQSTITLADKARSCDRANDSLNADLVESLSHMWIDYSLDVRKCLDKLVLMVRGKDA